MKGVMDSHLDLSFLTEDEYQTVLNVIQRDSELKKRDNERIKTAEKSIQDEKRRKLITGQWFDEVKAKRYRNSLLGVDLIKTSTRKKKPITHETTVKTESQQVHRTPSVPIPKFSQTTKYEDTSVSTDETSEGVPGEEENIPARRKMKLKSVIQQAKSLYDPWESSSDEPSSTEVAVRAAKKGQQRDTGANVSSPISEPASDCQEEAKNVNIHHPQTCQTPTGSDISTDLQMRCTSSVSRIPRRLNSMGASGDLGKTGEPTSPNTNIMEQDHINGQYKIPAVSSVESPTCEQAPDLTKQDNVAGSHCDRTQAYQAAEIRDQRVASTDDSSLITRPQRNLDNTDETWKAPEETEHINLNGQGFASVATNEPMSEKVLDAPKPKKSVATHYKGAPTYQIPEASDKRKISISSITRIPKWRSFSRESEALSTEKPESLASEPGPQGLPLAPANEDQQAVKTLEKLDLSPTSRIPRLKSASEATAGETPKAPVEDLKPSSRQLAGKDGTTEVTGQAKAAFQPSSRIAKYLPSSSDDDSDKGRKAVFTIHALGNKHLEDEIQTDPSHFKNLRSFWETGIESSKANNEPPREVSKIPSRRLRSPDYKRCPTEIKHSTVAESRSNLVTREIPPTNNFLKSERQGNQSELHSSEEEVGPLSRISKLHPVPTPRIKAPNKMGKKDAGTAKGDKHEELTPSMIDEEPEANVQRTHSNDHQTKDSLVPKSFEHGRFTEFMLSNDSSWDESLSNQKSRQATCDSVREETIKKEILPSKEKERKEFFKKIKKMAAESAPVDEFTMREAEDEVSHERPILPDNGHKAEMRIPVDSDTKLDRECQGFPNHSNEEIGLNSSKSDIPLLEQQVAPVTNDSAKLSLRSQVEALVDKSSEDDLSEPEKCNKHRVSRGMSEESKSLCAKARSGDAGVTASSTDELHCSVNINPIVSSKPLTFTGTHDNEDDLSGNAIKSHSRVLSEEHSNSVHSMDDSESNDDLQRMEPGPTYGLSPVMRALVRAKKAKTKSMDNLNSTTDRETIASSVIENEMKGDADDKVPAVNLPTLEHERVKELSKSVPLLMTESESDSASEVSFNIGWHRKTPSDASHSSDMASVSSVSGSIMSVYSGDFGSIDAQGSVQFALDYNEKNKEFQIYVSQCKDLAVVDEKKGRTDAYVKTYLLPDKARMGKRKTSVKRRNINPLYNEILKYKIEKSVLLIQKLNLSVWHNDTLGRNSFLGEVDVDLASWDWSNRELNWYLLKSRSPAVGVGIDHRGEINLAIKYVPPGALGARDPPTGEVHIWMKNAKDLPQLRSSGVDSFVKCYVLPDTSKKSYQKTRIVKKDTNPIYNHTIVYDGFRPEDLKEACVELTVWDHEKLTNHFLGGLRLGFGTGYSYGIPVEWMDSTEEEAALWQEMVSSPNEWIPGSLLLRPQLGGKKLK